MKIKTKVLPYEKAIKSPRPKRRKPCKPSALFRLIVWIAAIPDLIFTRFSYKKNRMKEAGNGPWLVLMNHSSFIDLEIASHMLWPKPYNIVSTTDGLVGKEWLMRLIGCIPTRKFVTSPELISDMRYALRELKSSVLMYPEAGYSFDGTSTTLPRRMGVLVKRLGVPVVMITTYGAYARDPLYNGLQKRKVRVSADMTCILSAQEVKEKSVAEIDAIIDKAFDFDAFKWQKENRISIKENFRADHLNRILYKCSECGSEGGMEGKGTELYCRKCGMEWHLTEYGELTPVSSETCRFTHIPDWYSWEREEVKREIIDGDYALEVPVDIGLLLDYKSLKMVGSGILKHDINGFILQGCGGKLMYEQKPNVSYSLNADYYWYEIGDVISIGTSDVLYYCFPKNEKDIVTKTRLAVEEMYKLHMEQRKKDRS